MIDQTEAGETSSILEESYYSTSGGNLRDLRGE